MKNQKKNTNLIPTLLDELIEEILLRLPVRSLLRFKCVCKSWFSLISNPQFAKSHFDLAASPTHRLLSKLDYASSLRSIDIEASFHDDSAQVYLPLPRPPSHFDNPRYYDTLRILGSCGWFILLGCVEGDFILWNPSTSAQRPISRPREDSKEFLFGFGYDASTDDYLVIIWTLLPSLRKCDIHFFSLKTNSWNKIEGINFPFVNDPVGLFFNGAVHWLCGPKGASNKVDGIIAFDLKEKSLTEIQLLQDFNPEFTGIFSYMIVIRGCLSVCYPENAMVGIWMMKEYKVQSSWTKVTVRATYDIPTNYFLPICFTEGNGIVGSNATGGLVKLNDKGELLQHHTSSPFFTKFRFNGAPLYTMYRESLLPLSSDKKN